MTPESFRWCFICMTHQPHELINGVWTCRGYLHERMYRLWLRWKESRG